MPTKAMLENENASLRRRVARLEKKLAALASAQPAPADTSASLHPALVESEKNLRAFFNTIEHLLFVLDEQGNIILINDAVTRRLGYSLAELLGQSVLTVHPAERRAEAGRIVGEMLAGTADYCPVPLLTKDGRQIPVETRVVKGTWSGQPVIFGVTKDLSEIKASEEKFAKVFHASPAPMAITDIHTGKYVAVNEIFLQNLGYTRDQVLGKTALELDLFVEPQQRSALLERMRGQGYLRNEAVLVRTHTGEVRHGVFSAEYVHLQDQTLLLTTMNDVTERKQAQEFLRQSEGRFARVFHANPAVQVITGVERGIVLDVNEAFCEQTGYSRDEAIGRTTMELGLWIEPDKQQMMVQTLQAGGHVRDIEINVQKRSGQVNTLLFSFEPIEINDIPCIISTGVDITGRKQAELALTQSERQYHHLVDALDVSLCRWLPDTTLTFANEKYCHLFGIQGNAVGQKWLAFLPAETQASTVAFYQEVAQHPRVVSYEHPVKIQDGSVRQYQWIDTPILNAAGTLVEFQSIGIDITERKRAEEALAFQHRELQNMVAQIEQSHNMLQSVIESIPVRVFWKDRDLRYLGCNTLFAQDAGLSRPPQLIGKDDFAMGWRDQADLYRNDDRQVIESQKPKANIVEPQTTPTGDTIWLNTSKVPLMNPSGEVYGILGVYEDITERKQAEQALRESEARLKLAQSVARSGVWDYDIVKDELFWTDEYYKLYGISKEILPSQDNWLRLVHPEDRELVAKSQDEAIARREYTAFDFRIIRSDGHVRWMNAQGAVILNSDNQPIRIIGTTVDITERKQAQDLIQAQRDLARIISNATTNEQAWVQCLDVTLRMSGMDSGGIYLFDDKQGTLKLVYHQGLGEAFIQATSHFPTNSPSARMVLAGKTLYLSSADLSQQKYHRDEGLTVGAMIPVQSQNQILGCINLASHTLTQVPEYARQALETLAAEIGNVIIYRRTDIALRESEEIYRSLIDSQDAAISTIDAQGVFHFINHIGAAPFGTPDFVVGKRVQDLFPPHIADWQLTQVRSVISSGLGLVREYETQINGKPSWRRVSIQPIHDAAGQITLAMVNSLDLTERKQAEHALKAEQERFASIAATVPGAICTFLMRPDHTLCIPYASKAFEDIYGLTLADVAENINALITRVSPDQVAQLVQAVEQSARTLQPWRNEYQYNHPTKGAIWLEGYSMPMRQADGSIAWHGITTDITARKQAEQAVRESEERYRNLVDLSPDGIVVHQDSKFVFVNASGIRTLGANSLAELAGQPIFDRIHPDNRAKTLERGMRMMKGEISNPSPSEDVYLKMDGSPFPVEVMSRLISYQGRPAVQVVVRDITERKQTEHALRESNEIAQAILNAATESVFLMDVNGTTIAANETAAARLGKRIVDLIGTNLFDLLPPDIVESRKKQIAHVVHQSKPVIFEDQRFGVWMENSIYPILDRDGQIRRVAIYGRDITDRKQAEMVREHQAARIQILHDLDSAILAGRTPVQIADHALALVAQIIPCDLGAVVLFDRETSETWLVGLHGETILPYDLGARGKMDPQFLGIMEQTGSWITSEATDLPHLDPMTRRIIAKGGYASIAHTAMLMDGPIFGGIRLFAHQPNAFTQEHVEIITEVANQLAIAIAQTRLREQIEKHTAELEARVQERTAEVQDLYDNAPAGYHSLDANGINVMINQTELNWLGYTRQELIGRPITDLLTPASTQSFREQFSVFLQQGFIKNLEFEVVRKDGSILPVLLSATAIYDNQGNLVNSRATLIDNTERKQAEQDLRASRDALNMANRELARASKLKDEFLANMSHELRTPLNAILGLSESLIEQLVGPLNERQLNALKTVESSGRHLLALINDILDLSKIEAGNQVLAITPVAVKPICEASLLFIKQTAHKKQIHVSSTIDMTVEWIAADDRRLKQMLVNLLGNAVKFTPPEGRIVLQVTGDAEAKTVNFSVRDTGIGIAPEDITHLFKPFVQLDGGLTRVHEGTGLGLALVARMAELHGGSVIVESEPGKGSCFTVVLPWSEEMQKYNGVRPIVRDATLPSDQPNTTRADASAPVILIAEDNEANIVTLSLYLQAKGYRIAVARHGGEALDMARADQPALILMDLQMPVLDGLEAIRRLRRESDPQLARTPVIALTALAMPGDRERSLAAGANDYLSKPVNMKQLIASVQQLVKDK